MINGLEAMSKIVFLVIFSLSSLSAMSDNLVFNASANQSKFNANVAEEFMHKFFTNSGWKQLPGEIGSNGIDGLYVKMKNGVVSDVLCVESKYKGKGIPSIKNGAMSISKSGIGTTVDGAMQMSKKWCKKKIDNLIKHGKPELRSAYKQVGKHIEKGTVRKKYYGFTKVGDKIKVALYNIVDEGTDKIKIVQSKGRPFKVAGEFDLKNPKTPYEKKQVRDFKKIIKSNEKTFTSAKKARFAKTTRVTSAKVAKGLGKKAALRAAARGAGKGASMGLLGVVPIIGIAAQIAWDGYVGYKIEMHDALIENNQKNIVQNSQFIDRLTKETELLGVQIDTHTYQLSSLTRQLLQHSSQFDAVEKQFEAVDQRFVMLTSQVVEVQTLADKNAKAIQQIKDGVYLTGVQKLNEYYDTNDTDTNYLDEAITELDKTKNIHNTHVEPMANHYLVIARYEKYLATGNRHELDELKKDYLALADYAQKEPDYLSLLNNAYLAISDLDESQLYFYRQILDDATSQAIARILTQKQFDKAMDMAETYIAITHLGRENPLYKKTYDAKRANYEKYKNFHSVRETMKILAENQNSLLNEAAVKYLYKESSFENALKVLRTKRFDNEEFRVKAIVWIYYIQKHDKNRELKALVKLILENPTYSDNIKQQIKEKICSQPDGKTICEKEDFL